MEYLIAGFETKGTKDLPSHLSVAPTAAESINHVDEYRPDFKGDVTNPSVRTYIERVVDDCLENWAAHMDGTDEEPDRRKVSRAPLVRNQLRIDQRSCTGVLGETFC